MNFGQAGTVWVFGFIKFCMFVWIHAKVDPNDLATEQTHLHKEDQQDSDPSKYTGPLNIKLYK